jgi:hypoxanthine phosphoribosyltransferase
VTPKILFSQEQIAARVAAIAKDIAASHPRPDMAVAILAGAFVFTADLVRALANEGLSLPVEFIWLRSYGEARIAGKLQLIVGPSKNVRGKTILLIDGVLDSGVTMAAAKELLLETGAGAVLTAVAIDKTPGARADFACFSAVTDFIVGYGMDDSGADRGLPYIGKV